MTERDKAILLPGSMFDDLGGWISDPQFMEVMHSSELLAHGLGKPVADAVTGFDAPQDGQYNVWVRTKNWTAFWTDRPGPGKFSIIIDGEPLETVFGTGSPEWHWQGGGRISLAKGRHSLAVRDLDGFDARFDSVLLTLDEGEPGEIDGLRRALLDIPAEPESKGRFDFVVVGGGVAGMCAAISAARLGSRVAIIQDRKVYGGNNSSEVRVGLGGRLNVGRFPSLGYLLNEFGPAQKGNARTADVYEDEKKAEAIAAEKNITAFTGYRVTAVEKDGARIAAVIATQVDNYKEIRVEGHVFADCTGDATLGVLAGAKWAMGRESKAVYGEPSAPDSPDAITLGASIQWYSEPRPEPVSFPDIDWGLPIDEETVQNARRGQWYWEVGMRDNMIDEAEKIRDYGMYVAYSNWSYLKNHSRFKEEVACEEFVWLSFYAGKRESRRLFGEHVLTENDLRNFVQYPDGCVSTSWYIDDHEPDPDNAARFKDPWLSRGRLTPLDYYPIPFRCLYNRDIENMFMAGRDISVSHLALGTVRVMRTCAMEGEVIGMAAEICRRLGCMPRDVYRTHFDKLKSYMEKGTGDKDMPYLQTYTLIDTTAERSENC
ncbi:MAG: FAD-dependent oxidoreductase [Bacteroidales bacterium]|nr:FAD-dependent oxidoreductase [Bacteroidales bacterium]